MKLNLETGTVGEADGWIRMAEQLGVDRAFSRDVVGAVFSYCRLRHGDAELDDEYLAFLVARSSFVANGRTLTADEAESIGPDRGIRERMFLRALACSDDPASLYDLYRMNLVGLRTSDVFEGGIRLSINLKKVAAGQHENLSFFWLTLFRRMAESMADWRKGCPGLAGALVRTGRGIRGTGERELFETAVRSAETRRGLCRVRLIWD